MTPAAGAWSEIISRHMPQGATIVGSTPAAVQ